MEEKIKICSEHQDYEVPLIYTFAFNGAEYWCPYCGKTGGMLGAGKDVEETEELKQKLKHYTICSYIFLHAQAMQTCYSTTFYGEDIKPIDLPDREKELLKEIRENYEYHKKVVG